MSKQLLAAALPQPALAGGCGPPHGENCWQLATHQASSQGPDCAGTETAAEAETTRTPTMTVLCMLLVVVLRGRGWEKG